MYREAHISIQRHVRYVTQGEPTAPHWIYLLHGYGQLASRFIRKFAPIARPDRLLIAPEGFHRFYLQGHAGHIGASWMTREDRQTDMVDYVAYLDQLHLHLSAAQRPEHITVIAFSQGVATAFRWIAGGRIPASRFLICSGVIPPDLDLDLNADTLRPIRLDYITGDQDPFKRDEEVRGALQRLYEQGLSCPTHVFEGKHRVDIPTISDLLDQH